MSTNCVYEKCPEEDGEISFIKEAGVSVYNPGGLGYQYMKDRPHTIQKNSVGFWVSPMYTDLWYNSTCNDKKTIGQNCDFQCPSYRGKGYAPTYWTGISTDDEARAAGMKCSSSARCSYGRDLCGRLLGPRIGLVPGIVKNVAKDNNKVSAMYVEYGNLKWTAQNANHFKWIASRTWDGVNLGRFIPRDVGLYLMAIYCTTLEKDSGRMYIFTRPECDELKDIDSVFYNRLMNTLCVGDTLKERKCREFCGAPDNNCDARLTEHCAALGPEKALDKTNSELCGCFMGNTFYKNYFSALQEKFKFNAPTSPSHLCYFDFCASSNIRPHSEKASKTKCPDIMTCFQNVDVRMDAGGKIVAGKVIIKQDAKCGSIKTRCTAPGDCKDVSDSTCVDGVCLSSTQGDGSSGSVPGKGRVCSGDAGCYIGSNCIDGKCAYTPRTPLLDNIKLGVAIMLSVAIIVGVIVAIA